MVRISLFTSLFICVSSMEQEGSSSCVSDKNQIEDEIDCPPQDTKFWSIQIPWGVPGRAYLTLVPGLRISPSKIPNAGFGVFSDTFIKKYTWLGEYEGEIVDAKPRAKFLARYAWAIFRGNNITGYVDAFYTDRSSYTRYVNMPLRLKDTNIRTQACFTKLFYMTIKDIYPGQELLVHYGLPYALNLNLDLNTFFDVSRKWRKKGLDLNDITQLKLLTGVKYSIFAKGVSGNVVGWATTAQGYNTNQKLSWCLVDGPIVTTTPVLDLLERFSRPT